MSLLSPVRSRRYLYIYDFEMRVGCSSIYCVASSLASNNYYEFTFSSSRDYEEKSLKKLSRKMPRTNDFKLSCDLVIFELTMYSHDPITDRPLPKCTRSQCDEQDSYGCAKKTINQNMSSLSYLYSATKQLLRRVSGPL